MFIAFRGEVLNWLLTVVGILFVVQGILSVANKDVTNGIISMLIGVVIILGGWLFIDIVMIVFGILIIVKGLGDLFNSR